MPANYKTLVAKFTAIEYTITYDLDGGSATGNPATYTIETASFTINNPVKTGYKFTGWTGSNGTTAQTTVTIAKGSTGNKEYKANWSNKSPEISLNVEVREGVSKDETTSEGIPVYRITNGTNDEGAINLNIKITDDSGVSSSRITIEKETTSNTWEEIKSDTFTTDSYIDNTIKEKVYGYYRVTITATDFADAVTEKTVKINVFNAKQKFLDDVYRNAFNRPIDSEGQGYWMKVLEHEKGGPDVVLLGIFSSVEMVERINSPLTTSQNYSCSEKYDTDLRSISNIRERYIRYAYVTFLQRKADDAGLDTAVKIGNEANLENDDMWKTCMYYRSLGIDPDTKVEYNDGLTSLIYNILASSEYDSKLLTEYGTIATDDEKAIFRKSVIEGHIRNWPNT